MREYLIGVTAAAMVCGIVKTLLPEKGTVGTVVRMLLGLLMLLVALQPFVGNWTDGLFDWSEDISLEGQMIVADAEFAANQEIRQRIKQQAEAYILSKAESLDAHLDVTVTLSDESPAVPTGVCMTGAVSPYAKQVISKLITEDLGINREEQVWIG